MVIKIIIGVILFLVLNFFLFAFICFMMTFYSSKRKTLGPDEYNIPPDEIYRPYKERMIGWIKQIRSLPHDDIEIKSFDGLTLRGRYYEYKKGAPIEIMFHGYRGDSDRDMCGGVDRCFSIGRNALIVDQRACGKSDGHVITFGIKERKDCLSWIDYTVNRFGKDQKIILTGISMGAATVVMAAGEELPDNVVCVLADCGYSSPKAIIKKVIKDMRLPVDIVYFVIKFAARLFGGFNVEEASAIEAAKRSRVPIIFIHGESDDFVPCDMSREMYDACASLKKLVTVPDAGHGLAFPINEENYLEALRQFEKEWNV